MVEKSLSVDDRIEDLQSQIRALSAKVDQLAQQFENPDAFIRHAYQPSIEESPDEHLVPDLLHNQSISTVLSNVATICFLMVIALVLRTIVDNGLIDQTVGSFIGMGYAGLLIGYGFRRFSKSHALIPVYSSCGTFLLYSIVYESYTRFESLSGPVAYLVLTVALIVMTVMGIQFILITPLVVGICGASLVGLSLGFPNPNFLLVGVLFVVANIAALRSQVVKGANPIRWIMVILTMFLFIFWTTKIQSLQSREISFNNGTSLSAFLLFLGLIFTIYLVHTLAMAMKEDQSFGAFEWILTAVTALGGCLVFRGAANHFLVSPQMVGFVGSILGIAYFILATFLGRKGAKTRKCITPYVLASLGLIGLSLPALTGEISTAILGWSLAAFGVSLMAPVWDNTRVLFFTVILQFVACIIAVTSTTFGILQPVGTDRMMILVGLTLFSILHYVLGRRNAMNLSENEWISSKRAHGSLVFVLSVGCFYSFVILRKILYSVFTGESAAVEESFQCSQSILINVMALVLMFLGLRLKNGQIVGIGFLAVGLGAAKVFGYDFWNIEGLEIVFGVLSFGVTAGLGSLVWKRWQQLDLVDDQEPLGVG